MTATSSITVTFQGDDKTKKYLSLTGNKTSLCDSKIEKRKTPPSREMSKYLRTWFIL